MTNYTEIQIFSILYVFGIIVNIVFDLFRSLRKVYKHKDIIVYIEDTIFLLFSSTIVLIGIFKLNNGILRFYLLLALILRYDVLFFDIKQVLCYNFYCSN